jgi:hypothetical protein
LFQILFDPKEHREGLLEMGERHERLPDGDWIRTVRRALKDDTLFLYYHKETGNFVLASQVEEGVCQELIVYPHHPGREFHPKATLEYLHHRMRPFQEHLEGMQRDIRARRYHEKQLVAERSDDRHTAARFLRRRGLDQAAKQIRDGYVPFVGKTEGGDRLAEFTDKLKSSMR